MKYITILLVALFLASCNEREDVRATKNIIRIEGCEYIEVAYHLDNNGAIYSLTHKGNCTNPIHIHNGGNHE